MPPQPFSKVPEVLRVRPVVWARAIWGNGKAYWANNPNITPRFFDGMEDRRKLFTTRERVHVHTIFFPQLRRNNNLEREKKERKARERE